VKLCNMFKKLKYVKFNELKWCVMIKFIKWVNEIYKSNMTMWYSKQTQNEYILW